MKKTIKALKIVSLLSLILLAFIACDKDFSSLESDIQGYQDFSTNSEKFPVVTYNKKLNPVQTNDITSNLLGVYKDEKYGTTVANIVSQVTLSSYDPDFGDNAVIDSVMLTIPYYVTTEVVDSENVYEIDSLFGNEPIKLSIYENKYFLRDYDPENIEEFQKYYSNGNGADFDGVHRGDLLYQDNIFFPSNEAIDIELSDEEEDIIAPSLYVDLNTVTPDFWKNLLKVDDSDSHTELSNVNNFKNYFRGLFFKAESISNNDGNLIMLNLNSASIVVKYTNDGNELDDDGNPVRERQTYELNLSGNRLNIFENTFDATILAEINNADEVNGDEKLYLKGGEGSIAIIDLFSGPDTDNDGNSDAYEDFINTYKDQRLINEANLVFYVDETANLNSEQEPNRLIIYDVENNVPISDYFLDVTNTSSPEDSKAYHSTILERDSDNNGVKYKIRLTEHLNNILLKDSTNLKLGLMVTTNINEVFQYSILDNDDKLTSGTIMSPKGTILHGGNINVPEEKRVQLEIFYTEPEN